MKNNEIKILKASQIISPPESAKIYEQANHKLKVLKQLLFNLGHVPYQSNLLKACCVLFNDTTFEAKLDANAYLLGFDNGVIDLTSGQLRPVTVDDMISLSCGYDYIEEDEHGRFDMKNADSLQNHPIVCGIINMFMQIQSHPQTCYYLLILLSSFLVGANPLEYFHIWEGLGGNGKTKIIEIALGDYAKAVAVSLLTGKAGACNQASPIIAMLRGIRLVLCEEPGKCDAINCGTVKYLTGGSTVTCRRLYGKDFSYTPQFKIVMACNFKPNVDADDGGFWRRFN